MAVTLTPKTKAQEKGEGQRKKDAGFKYVRKTRVI